MNLEKAIHVFLLNYPNAGTRKAYRSCLIPMQHYIGLSRPIQNVKNTDVIEYVSTVYEHDYALATIRKHIISIKAFFNFLVKNDILEKSPAAHIKRPRLKRNIDRSKAMTDEQLNQLLDLIKWLPRHDALVRFLADTGCRIGGASTLQVSDIDFENCRAVVTEKGDKTRMVAFGVSTANALRVWLLKRPSNACDYVFAGGQTNIKTNNLAQLFRRACIKVGIGSYGPHSLRHRKGYQLSDAKVSLSVAATVLGHESTDTTLHYYPKDWDRAEQALKSLALSSEPIPHILKLPKMG